MEIPKVPTIQQPTVRSISVTTPTIANAGYLKYEREQRNKAALFFDYNNPYQVNSYADVVGRTAKKLIEENKLPIIGNLIDATGQLISDTASLNYNSFIKPLIYGGSDAGKMILLNNLNNMFETLDILANPVKGYVLGGEQGAYDAFFNRVNYDYDTGNLAADIAAEIVSDPINWVTFGASAIGKAALSASAKVSESLAKEVGEKASRRLMSSFYKDFTGNTAETITKLRRHTDLTPTVEHILKDITLNKTTMNVIKATKTIGNAANVVDSVITKTAFYSSFGMPAYIAKKGAIDPIRNMMVRQMQHGLTAMTASEKTPLSLVKFFDNEPEILRLATTLDSAADNITNFPAHVKRDVVTTLVHREHRKLTELLSYKKSDMLDDTFRKALNQQVSKLTDGLVTHFPDYVERITRLAEANVDVPLLGVYVDELMKYKSYYDRAKLAPTVVALQEECRVMKKQFDTLKHDVLAGLSISVTDVQGILSSVYRTSPTQMSHTELTAYVNMLQNKAKLIDDPEFTKIVKSFPTHEQTRYYAASNKLNASVKKLNKAKVAIAKRFEISLKHIPADEVKLFNQLDKQFPYLDTTTRKMFSRLREAELLNYNALKEFPSEEALFTIKLNEWKQSLWKYTPANDTIVKRTAPNAPELHKNVNWYLTKFESFFDKVYNTVPTKSVVALDGTIVDTSSVTLKHNVSAAKEYLSKITDDTLIVEDLQVLLESVKEALYSAIDSAYYFLDKHLDEVSAHLDFTDFAEALHTYVAGEKEAANLMDSSLTRILSSKLEVLSENLNSSIDTRQTMTGLINDSYAVIKDLDTTLYSDDVKQLVALIVDIHEHYTQLVEPLFYAPTDLDVLQSLIKRSYNKLSSLIEQNKVSAKLKQDNLVTKEFTHVDPAYDDIAWRNKYQAVERKRAALEKSGLQYKDPDLYERKLDQINAEAERLYEAQLRFEARMHEKARGAEVVAARAPIEDLHPILEQLQELYHVDMLRSLPQSNDPNNPIIEYTEKLLTLSTYHRLLDNEDAIALMNSIENKTEYYDALLVLEGLGSNAAFKLRATLEGMGNYLKFVSMLQQSRLPENIQGKLLDTMQNYSWLDKYGLGGVYEVSEHEGRANHIRNIVDDTADALMSNSSTRNYKLENFSQVIKQRHPEWFTRFKGDDLEHTAMYDAYATAMLDREMGLFEHKGLQTRRYYADIETAGFNANQSSILQIGVYDAETDELFNFIVGSVPDNTLPPSQQVLDLLYGGDANIYHAIHNLANESVANARFGEGAKHIMCSSEAEALEQFQMILKRDQSMLVDNVLTFHNGNQFDVEFINTRLKENQMKPIAARKIEDTLEAWRAKEGIEYMSRSQKAEAERLLREYINLREMEQVSQDSLMRALDQGGISLLEFSSIGDRGRFIPKLDREFTDNLSEVIDTLLDNKEHQLSVQLAGHLTNIRTALINTLKGVKESNIAYSRHRIYKHDLAKAFDEVKPGIFDDVEDEVMKANKNIMLYFNGDGTAMNPLNPKITYDEAALRRWFNLDWDAQYKDGFIQYLTKLGRKMTRAVDNVDLIKKLGGVTNINRLRALRASYIDLHNQIIPSDTFTQLRTLFKESDNIVEEFVMTQAVFQHLLRTVTNDAVLSKEYTAKLVSHDLNDIRYHLRNTNSLRRYVERSAETSQRYWQLNLSDDAASRYLLNTQKQVRSIDELRKLATQKAALGIATPKSETQAVLHERIYELFQYVHAGIDEVEDDSAVPRYYAHFKKAFDMLDFKQSQNNIYEFLSLSPAEMQSRLYHQGNFITTFKLSDLMASKEVESVNSTALVKMYKDMVTNEAMYGAVGISMFEYADRAWIVLNPDDLAEAVKYIPIRADHRMDYQQFLPSLEDVPADWITRIKQTLHEYDSIRSDLGSKIDNVGYSTLENLDEYAMKTIYDRIPEEVLKRLPSLNTLRAHGAFTGSKFNHTVLGTAPSRHELMPYSSYNPAKNLHAAIDLVQSRLDETIKYEAYIDSATHRLDGAIYKGIPDADLVEYFKGSNGAMRLVFKAPSKRPGQTFEVKSIHVNSEADLDFARRVNAVVMTEHMYTKSVSILNQNGLRNPFLKAFEKTIVTPSKIGMLLFKEGFVLRNLLDSTIKNMVDTGDPIGIMRHTLDTAALYFKYKQANLEMIAMAKELHLSLREVIPMYFKTPRAIDKDIYELVHRFKIDGYSGGMTKELKNYYGEATDKLYRVSGIERWGITKAEFEQLVHAPQEVALEQLAARFPNDNYLLSQFKSMQQNYHFYKRSYEMLKHTRNQEFNLENLVEFIQTPDKVPARLVPEFDELMNKTVVVNDSAGMVDQFMELSPVKAFFDINVGLEEIFRLTNYTYHMKYNLLPEHEALSHTLKTHFDYAHKAQWQYYTELLFPFSTFKLNNFMFWWDHFNTNPMALKMLEDVMGEVMALDEYSHDDVAKNRSLQYHILAGNLVLKDNEANIVVKLSPSVMDTLTMLVDPEGSMASSLVAPLKVAYELSTNPKQSYESVETYGARVQNTLVSSIPLVGPVTTGLQGAQKLATATGGAPYSIFSSTLGVVKYPKKKLARTYGKKLYSSYTRPGAHKNLLKRYRYYHALTNRTLFATGYYSRRHNIQIMTRKGGAIARYLSMPTNKYTNNMKVALLRTRF